ncbi:MAG: 5-carboxymethyl-2-hydroxymuconate isomerase [Planctomycetaceae bacterium]|nr:5-carboxymethyl-2-hydroxymuconate isomerase [Planctomycetaceae bacterium]|tara:strand:+ start:339 stop:1295 length:957 start_codon:yes stop_codon:yes gene_type:complete
MRISRYEQDDQIKFGFYADNYLVEAGTAAEAFNAANGDNIDLSQVACILELLPPCGALASDAEKVAAWLTANEATEQLKTGCDTVQLLVPIARPNKLFLLAGNYSAHVQEGGEQAIERAETFPYVFMKPPTTTLTNPGQPIEIPKVNPNEIDWELELAIVIGKKGKHISEAQALDYVAGYTVINDISDRAYHPFPDRKERSRDAFFDWMHGKWHDSFCPCGPCIATPTTVTDPQALDLKLSLNEELRQDSTTALQVFPVAAVIEFISQNVTLEPGDIISTGTPDGVGKTTGTFITAGDTLHAHISSIGTLTSPVINEA